MKFGAVVIISISSENACGNIEDDLSKLALGFCSILRISRVMRISEIANVSASSTTKPGKIKASARSVPTAETTNIIANPIISVNIRICISSLFKAIVIDPMKPIIKPA